MTLEPYFLVNAIIWLVGLYNIVFWIICTSLEFLDTEFKQLDEKYKKQCVNNCIVIIVMLMLTMSVLVIAGASK